VEAATFREIELELAAAGTEAILEATTAALLGAGAGAPDPMSKVTRALGPRALAPTGLDGPVPDADASVAEVVAAALRLAVSEIIANDHVIRLDDDIAGLNRTRWALRRLRADLKTFTRQFNDTDLDQLRRELRWLSGGLGRLGRTEALIAGLEQSRSSARDADADAAVWLIDRARAERARARAALLDAIESDRYVALLDAAVAITSPTALFDPDAAAASEVIPSVMTRVWKRVRSAVRELPDEPSEEDIRQVRRQIIRLRSAAGLAVPVFGAPASAFAKRIAQAHQDLEDHLDALSCERWLRSRAESLDGTEALVAEQLAVAQAVAADESLRCWLDSWRACSTRSALAWFRP